MRLKKTMIAALMAAGGLAASQASIAQGMPDRGWYAGGSLGQSDTDCEPAAGLSCDNKDTAWKAFGGYQLNRNFAVEFGYTNLGEVSASGGGVNISVESTAWELVGVGSFPLANQFSVYGKLGFFRAEAEVSSNIAGGSGSKTTTDLTYGLGVRYDFSRNLGLRAEWQRYAKIEAPETTVSGGDSDFDVLSVGIVWRF